MQIAELYWLMEDAVAAHRTLRLRVGGLDVTAACDQAAREIRPRVAVPGYRIGKGPLALIVQHHWDKVRSRAFGEIKSAALKQAIEQLPEADKPFTPPEVVEPDGVRLRYGRELEFAVRFLVDPAKISQHPEQPEQPKAGEATAGRTGSLPIGVPLGPQLPTVAMPGGAPALPSIPAALNLSPQEAAALADQPAVAPEQLKPSLPKKRAASTQEK